MVGGQPSRGVDFVLVKGCVRKWRSLVPPGVLSPFKKQNACTEMPTTPNRLSFHRTGHEVGDLQPKCCPSDFYFHFPSPSTREMYRSIGKSV